MLLSLSLHTCDAYAFFIRHITFDKILIGNIDNDIDGTTITIIITIISVNILEHFALNSVLDKVNVSRLICYICKQYTKNTREDIYLKVIY